MKKKIYQNPLILIFILAVLVFFLWIIIPEIIWTGQPSEEVLAMRRIFEEEKYVIHAGGAVVRDGERYTHTNSREALENALASGNRLIELDFMLSADGYYICGHDGYTAQYPWLMGLTATEALDKEEFLKQKIYGFLTPMDLESLMDIMREQEDFYIVTDVKEDNLRFCKTVQTLYPDLMNRFIIQIYHDEEYAAIHELGFSFIQFTDYRLSRTERFWERPNNIVKRYNLVGFTLGVSYYHLHWGKQFPFFPIVRWWFFQKTQRLDCPLDVYTVDDREEQQKLFDAGVSVICTNETDNSAYR